LIKDEGYINYVGICLRIFYIDGSVCRDVKGVGNIFISPNNVVYDASVYLNNPYTNSQIEYEALLFGLQILVVMGVMEIRFLSQNKSEFQCFDGLLNSYFDRCLDIIKSLDTITIYHIPREEISRAYCLAQRASGHYVGKKKGIVERPMLPAVENDSTHFIF
jgi:ribonuclease HI